MVIEEKDGLILLFQIDQLSGEEVGWILETDRIPGVRNLQLISTLTKKGRPGYLLLLDVDPKRESNAVQTLSEFMPFFGYHRLRSRHVIKKGMARAATVVVHAGDRSVERVVRFRLTCVAKGICRAFLEADDLVELNRRVKKDLKVALPVFELKQRINLLLKRSKRERVEIKL
jgi:uncharacterized protein (DUF111 family)